ncbi:MAG: tyrosine-type recombinase/integrase [Bacteroidetes bacterium]|nr:tyrosine-type recombinase/integrase [Bacteroidota bacterium]
MDTLNILSTFLDYLRIEKRYSEHTLVAYKNDLNHFTESLGVNELEDWKEVNHRSIRSWIMELHEEGKSNRTINRKLSALRSLFKFLRKQKIIISSPLTKVKGPKIEKRLPQFVKVGQMTKVDFDPSVDVFEAVGDELMVEIFYQTGVRLSELINLLEKDIQANTIKVLGKRNKERIIPISNNLYQMIENYRFLKSELNLKHECLFVLKSGEKLYPKFVYRKINSYLGKVTIMDKKSPHVLRHTFATHLLNNGAGLETLKELLGHANLSATQVYTHNSFTQISNIYSQAHPRGRKTN